MPMRSLLEGDFCSCFDLTRFDLQKLMLWLATKKHFPCHQTAHCSKAGGTGPAGMAYPQGDASSTGARREKVPNG